MKPTCPHCGGDVVVVTPRAWCVKRYEDGGCGHFWPAWDTAIYSQRSGPWKISYTAAARTD